MSLLSNYDPGKEFEREWGRGSFWDKRALGKHKQSVRERKEVRSWFKDAGAGPDPYITFDAGLLTYKPTAKLFDGSARSQAYLKEIFGGGVIEKELMSYLDERNNSLPGTFEGITPLPDGENRIDSKQADGVTPGVVSVSATKGEKEVLPISNENIYNMVITELLLQKEKSTPGFLAKREALLMARSAKGEDVKGDIAWAKKAQDSIALLESRKFKQLSPDEKRIVFGDFLESWQPEQVDEDGKAEKGGKGAVEEIPVSPQEITELYGYDVEPFEGEKNINEYTYTKEYRASPEYAAEQAVRVQKEIMALQNDIARLESRYPPIGEGEKLDLKKRGDRERMGGRQNISTTKDKIKKKAKELSEMELKLKAKSDNGTPSNSTIKSSDRVHAGAVATTFKEKDFEGFVEYMENGGQDFRNSDVFKNSMSGIRATAIEEVLKEKGVTDLDGFIKTRKLNTAQKLEAAALVARDSAFDIAYATGQFDPSFIANEANRQFESIYNLTLLGMPIATYTEMNKAEQIKNSALEIQNMITKNSWTRNAQGSGVLGTLASDWEQALIETKQGKAGQWGQSRFIDVRRPEGAKARGYLKTAIASSHVAAAELQTGMTNRPAIIANLEHIEMTSDMIADALVIVAHKNFEANAGIFHNLGQRLFGDQTKDLYELLSGGIKNKMEIKRNDKGEVIGINWNVGEEGSKPIFMSSADINDTLGDGAMRVLDAFFNVAAIEKEKLEAAGG